MAFYVASLAQLVEQMTLNHWVAGSSPAGSTKLFLREVIEGSIKEIRWEESAVNCLRLFESLLSSK